MKESPVASVFVVRLRALAYKDTQRGRGGHLNAIGGLQVELSFCAYDLGNRLLRQTHSITTASNLLLALDSMTSRISFFFANYFADEKKNKK